MEIPEPQDIPLSQLRAAAWNANRVPESLMVKIRSSIAQFGFVENLVARPHPEAPDAFEVLSGNHRLQILRELGHETAPVVVVQVDDAKARLLAQTLNRTRGRDDPIAYRQLLNDLLEQLSMDEVTSVLPETEKSIQNVIGDLHVENVEMPQVWGVIVDCVDEDDQVALLARFEEKGRDCRPLMVP